MEVGHLMYAQDWVCVHVSIPSKLLLLEIQGVLVNSNFFCFPIYHMSYNSSDVILTSFCCWANACHGGSNGLKCLLQEFVCSGFKECFE
jgi:hypothetical protein